MDLDFRQLQRIEAGRVNVTVATLERVAAGFEVAASSLLEGEARQSNPLRPVAKLKPRQSPSEASFTDSAEDVLARIAERCASLRLAAGLSQRELAERIGLSLSFVQSVEGGKKSLTVRSLVLLSKALGVHPQDLLAVDVAAAR